MKLVDWIEVENKIRSLELWEFQINQSPKLSRVWAIVFVQKVTRNVNWIEQERREQTPAENESFVNSLRSSFTFLEVNSLYSPMLFFMTTFLLILIWSYNWIMHRKYVRLDFNQLYLEFYMSDLILQKSSSVSLWFSDWRRQSKFCLNNSH